ncbi:MAG: hypothetical protein AAGI71_17350 [Bacteroidota bacterium]
MTASRPSSRYVTDGRGQRIAVILDLERCEHVLDTAEELADIRALDEAQASGDGVIPLDQARREIERGRS